MSNIAQALKAEIIRLSRKEVKATVAPLRKSNFALKKAVWDLKDNVSALTAENKRLSAIFKSAQENQPAIPPEAAEKARFTSKGIRILRTKLGLSQESFAKLLGVSSQAVYVMEHKEGKRLKFRPKTLSSLLSAREMGKRDAQRRLEEIAKKKQLKSNAKKRSKR
jgi:DNA-binding transcriptional regulator YiaG